MGTYFNKVWAKYKDLETGKVWQGVLVLKIGQTLKDYEQENKIKVIKVE